ncbi:MAG: tRNA (adenosine(37)-N6)-dimethylallyltransferase MiaA [Chloroflexi bacterium]|nr:tRNA (adenosine(37)-N6)-dimethylallyltransferase MiaA [Chloroflexota bacterium]
MSGTSSAGQIVLALVGPTAVGKTELAMHLARSLEGEIVSLDSRQMYRGMDIGTAKPSAAERAAVPHHLIDLVTPDRSLSLAEVQSLALTSIDAILARGRLPILAGGTGQYLRALVDGWVIPAVPPDPELRAELYALADRLGAAHLHARLAAVDPVSAGRIHVHNLRRVIRALEVQHHLGEPISDIQDRAEPRHAFRIAGLRRSREVLYARIDARIDAMLAAGLEAELRRLVSAGYGFDLPAMSALGYREWQGYLAGEIDLVGVRDQIRRNTRRLARSQDGWFRADDPRLREFDLDLVPTPTLIGDIRDWLAGRS